MDHVWLKERLLDFFDAELPEEEKQKIRQHLETCAVCCNRLEHWKATRQTLSGFLKTAPCEAFVDEVMAKVEAIPARRPVGWGLGWDRLGPRIRIPAWAYPELGLAVAAALLFALGSLQQRAVSAEVLLLSREPRDIQWIGLPQTAGGSSLEILWGGV